jgi:hypothetical protein
MLISSQEMEDPARVSKQLSLLVGRWAYDLRELNLPWSYGIVKKCCDPVEDLLRVCAATLLPWVGGAGPPASRHIGPGKPIARMTIAELVELLIEIDLPVSAALGEKYPCLNLRGSVLCGLATKIRRLSKIADEFAHDRVKAEDERKKALELLSHVASLCRSQLLTVVVALHRGGKVR